MSELEPDVRPPEHVDGDGQLDLLRPARAVVVIQHQRVVLIRTWLPSSGSHVTLQDKREGEDRGGGEEGKKEQEVKTGNERPELEG